MWVGRKWRPICEDRAPYVQAVGVGKVVCRWVAGQGRAGQAVGTLLHALAVGAGIVLHVSACSAPPRPATPQLSMPSLLAWWVARHLGTGQPCIHVYMYTHMCKCKLHLCPPSRPAGSWGCAAAQSAIECMPTRPCLPWQQSLAPARRRRCWLAP